MKHSSALLGLIVVSALLVTASSGFGVPDPIVDSLTLFARDGSTHVLSLTESQELVGAGPQVFSENSRSFNYEEGIAVIMKPGVDVVALNALGFRVGQLDSAHLSASQLDAITDIFGIYSHTAVSGPDLVSFGFVSKPNYAQVQGFGEAGYPITFLSESADGFYDATRFVIPVSPSPPSPYQSATFFSVPTRAVTSFSSQTVATNSPFSVTFGFTPNRNIKITDLGVWDEGGDGFSTTVEAQVRLQGGVVNQLVASTSIPAGTTAPLMAGFRYAPLSGTVLQFEGAASSTWEGAYVVSYGGEPFRTNIDSLITAPEIRQSNAFNSAPQFGPNFLFTTALLANADFERLPFDTQGFVTNWEANGNVSAVVKGAGNPEHAVAFNRASDSEGNKISQSFFTTPNQRYSIEFDAAVYGQRSGDPLHLNVQITGPGGGTVLNLTVTPPDAFTFDFAAVSFQRYHFEFVAGVISAILQFTDVGLGNANAEILLDSISIASVPPPFAAWQALYFTPEERNDPSVSGWDADPDHDGIPNGLEFYFNFNPRTGLSQTEAADLPRISVQTNSISQVTLTYRRRIGAGGLIGVEGPQWDERTAVQPTLLTATPTGDGVTERVTVGLSRRGFFRLTVMLAPSGNSVSRAKSP